MLNSQHYLKIGWQIFKYNTFNDEISGHIKKLGRIYNFEEKVTDGFFNIFFFSTRRFTVTF